MSWRQHHGHATTPAPLEEGVASGADLKWKAGGSGADNKERAKQLRKYAEQRGQLREAEREKKEAEKKAKEEATRLASSSDAAETPRERPICTFFLAGKCSKGDKCKFKH